MAKIPLGQFGYRTPQGQDTTPVAGPDMQVGDALSRLGSQVAANGASMLAEQQRENQMAADRADQAKTALAHVNIQNGLADQYDGIHAKVMSGEMDKVQATAMWKDATQKIISDNVATAPRDRAPLLAAQAKGVEGKLTNSLFDTFRKRDDQDAIAGVTAAEEGLQRLAGKDLQGAIQQQAMLIDGSPLPADQKAKRKQAFVENAYYNKFRGEAQGAMQSGSIEALDRVQMRMSGAEGDPLDPTKRNALDQTIYGWKQNLQAKADRGADLAEREATKRFNAATDTLNKNRDIALGGGFIAPEQIALIVEQTQGIPELQAQAKELFASQTQVAGFASLPPNKRAAVLESARADRANPKVGIDPLGQKQLDRAEQIDAKLKQQVDSGEAWSAAQSVGVIGSAPLLNLGNPQEAMSVFQKRMADIGSIEAWAGRKVSPLQPPEAAQLAKMVTSLPPDQAASMLGTLGGVLGDKDRIAAVAKQIGDKDNILGSVMAFAGAQTSENRYTAELILRGEQMIRDKAIKTDGAAETGWKAAISKEVRGTYSNPEIETQLIEAAFRIAAAKGGDVDNALRLATGGIIERNGLKVPLPYGMKEAAFEKKMEAFTPESLADQTPGGVVVIGPNRMPVADFIKTLPDARLVHAGQGMYNVRAGNQLVLNERGQRVTLKVSP